MSPRLSTPVPESALRSEPASVSSPPPALTLALERAIEEHDRRTARSDLWLGAEPTFTDRDSEAKEWLTEALGADKEARAQRLIGLLLSEHPGALIVRPLGR